MYVLELSSMCAVEEGRRSVIARLAKLLFYYLLSYNIQKCRPHFCFPQCGEYFSSFIIFIFCYYFFYFQIRFCICVYILFQSQFLYVENLFVVIFLVAIRLGKQISLPKCFTRFLPNFCWPSSNSENSQYLRP